MKYKLESSIVDPEISLDNLERLKVEWRIINSQFIMNMFEVVYELGSTVDGRYQSACDPLVKRLLIGTDIQAELTIKQGLYVPLEGGANAVYKLTIKIGDAVVLNFTRQKFDDGYKFDNWIVPGNWMDEVKKLDAIIEKRKADEIAKQIEIKRRELLKQLLIG